MPRACSICTHVDCLAIETALGRGTSLRTIAARPPLSYDMRSSYVTVLTRVCFSHPRWARCQWKRPFDFPILSGVGRKETV
jgi:hypothetical protein